MKLNKATVTALIRKQGISQNELARLIKVNHGSLSNALSGRRSAGRKLLAGLLRQFPNESVASLTERG
ncbi:MAG: XRE family transcriptional regulator [Desulfosporosinus sp.]|nr:XRE family transcriptional regulator [Desulfosporosinus sp.]